MTPATDHIKVEPYGLTEIYHTHKFIPCMVTDNYF